MTEEGFLKGMFKLNLQWRDHEMPADAVALYRERLGMLTDQEFMAAVNHCIDFGDAWYPEISDLKRYVLTLRNQGRPSAAERWGQLLELASQGAPEPTDLPTKRALSTVGGWYAFQFEPEAELNFRRKEFERVYGEVMAEDDRAALLGIAGPQGQKRLEG